MLSYQCAGTCDAHFNVISALDDNEHRVDALFLFDLVIARQDGSCTLCCLGGGSKAWEADARDDEGLGDALRECTAWISTTAVRLGWLTKINGRNINAYPLVVIWTCQHHLASDVVDIELSKQLTLYSVL
jgi:hypothetical protein